MRKKLLAFFFVNFFCKGFLVRYAFGHLIIFIFSLFPTLSAYISLSIYFLFLPLCFSVSHSLFIVLSLHTLCSTISFSKFLFPPLVLSLSLNLAPYFSLSRFASFSCSAFLSFLFLFTYLFRCLSVSVFLSPTLPIFLHI